MSRIQSKKLCIINITSISKVEPEIMHNETDAGTSHHAMLLRKVCNCEKYRQTDYRFKLHRLLLPSQLEKVQRSIHFHSFGKGKICINI